MKEKHVLDRIISVLRMNGYSVYKNGDNIPKIRHGNSIKHLRDYCRAKYGRSPVIPEYDLKKRGVHTIGHLVMELNKNEHFLLTVRAIGKKSNEMILSSLGDAGLI